MKRREARPFSAQAKNQPNRRPTTEGGLEIVYYLSVAGDKVHLDTCSRLGKAQLWQWARGKSNALIALRMSEDGITPCGVCYPPLFPSKSSLRLVR